MNAQRWSILAVLVLLGAALVAWITQWAGGESQAEPGAPTVATGPEASSAAPPAGAADEARRLLAGPELAAADLLRVSGRVVDAYGEPLARALVGEASAERPSATADDGRFELVARRGRPVALLVLASGHAPSLSALEIATDARLHDVGDVQLLRGGSLEGSVTGAAGKGLAGATVRLRFSPPSAWPSWFDVARLLPAATTGDGGGYTFSHLVPGTYRVLAAAPGRQAGQSAQVTVRDGADTAVEPIALAVGHRLTGRVLGPDERPVAQAVVRVRGDGQPRFDGQVETTAEGAFEIVALPAGALRLEVSKPGFLRHERAGVDATRGEAIVVRLEGGLRITGTVVDARSGAPVETFAVVVRRIGELDPQQEGTMTQQLGRQIAALRTAALAADAERRDESLKIASELEARLAAVRSRERSRPLAVPADVGPVASRPQGKLAIDGLEEGLYSVGVASPDHQFAQQAPIEVRRARPAPDLRFELVAGLMVSGRVTSKRDRAPIAGASVELVRVHEAAEASEQRSLYPWVFAPSGPQGVTVMSTRSANDGGFELRQVASGRYYLAVRQARIADHDTAPFDLHGDSRKLAVEVGARASLSGRVGNGPRGQAGGVSVLVLGGHGTLRTVKAGADGRYRCDDLQPGSYLVRAFPADASQYVNRLFGSIFPLHAGAVDAARVPERDVTLAAGEDRVLDLVLDLPPTGVVEGGLAVNGQPGKGAQAILRPLPGEAPGAGGQSLRATGDDQGRFRIADVPAGRYTLVVTGVSRQELHTEPLTVAPSTTALVQVAAECGGLRGRVRAPDGAPAAELRGYVWVLPGATEEPADLYEYRRSKRVHRISVRDGAFEDTGLTPGPALVVADIRGRSRVVSTAVIPARSTVHLDLTAGRRQP